MDNNFRQVPLNKLVTRVKVGFVGSCEKFYCKSTEGYPIIRTTDLVENGINYNNLKYITKEFHEKNKKSQLNHGDLLIARHGDNGKARIYNRHSPSQALNVVIIEPDDSKLSSYLIKCFFEFDPIKSQITNVSSGSVQNVVNTKIISDLLIPISNKINYTEVGEILSNLEYKIELNNKINKELEAMAKTLYDYWFVQFDFPNENEKPYKSSGGIMVYNQELKREIPQGWEVKTISQLIGNNKGGDWGKEQEEVNYTQKVFCIRGADLNGLNGLGELNPPERFILDKNSNKILESHDLIVEISGGSPTQSTGRLSFVIDETITRFENPLICSNFCKSFSLKNSKHFYYFIYMWNNLYDNSVLFGWEGKTSGIKNLLFDSFTQKYFVVVPNESINQNFYEKINSFHKMKQKNLKENQELAKLRDWLLPMLMNGQVRVNIKD
jgi:type I restriction enzyme S subunit